MDLFDIIGPTMIGPSSSHTAGAARIGNICRLISGIEVTNVKIGLYGSFLKTYKGHGTDRALLGGLMGMSVDDERLRDSLKIAEDNNVNFEFYEAKLKKAHPNTVVVGIFSENSLICCVEACSVGGGEVLIDKINNFDTCIDGHTNTFVIFYADKLGMIASISKIVSSHEINIATMKVSRNSCGGEAMMTLEIDGSAEKELIQEIKSLKNINSVSYLEFVL